MYSFPRVQSESNTIGYSHFYFLPKRMVTLFPRAVNKVITTNLVLTHAFYAGYSVFGEIGFVDDPQRTEAGVRYPVKVSGVAPVDKVEYLSLFEEMVDDEFIVVVRSNNNMFKICGTADRGMKFLYKTEGVGYRFEFSGEFKEAPPFYSGLLPVDSTFLQSPYNPATVYTVGGFWIFGSTVPDPGIGKAGDGYFDYLTNLVYEKQGNTWVQVGYLGPDLELEEYAFNMATLAITGNLI